MTYKKKKNNVLCHGMSGQPQLKQEAGITSRHYLLAQQDTSDISYNTRETILHVYYKAKICC